MALPIIISEISPTFGPNLLFQAFLPGNMPPPSASRPAPGLTDEVLTGRV